MLVYLYYYVVYAESPGLVLGLGCPQFGLDTGHAEAPGAVVASVVAHATQGPQGILGIFII